jgi:hypothetical protein
MGKLRHTENGNLSRPILTIRCIPRVNQYRCRASCDCGCKVLVCRKSLAASGQKSITGLKPSAI